MKKHLLAVGLAALGFGAPAFAADMPVKAPPVAAPVQYTWTGHYIGLHGGGGWADTNWTFPFSNFYTVPIAGASQNFSPDGLLGGAHAGFNYQMGYWVVGLEGSLTYTDLSETRTGGFNAAFPADHHTVDIKTLATVTARVGYAFNNWLAYAKGGWATGNVSITSASGPPVAGVVAHVKSNWQDGWTVGAGLEYMLTKNLVFGVEYNYIQLDADSYTQASPPGAVVVLGGYTVNLSDIEIHSVLARLSFKFP